MTNSEFLPMFASNRPDQNQTVAGELNKLFGFEIVMNCPLEVMECFIEIFLINADLRNFK